MEQGNISIVTSNGIAESVNAKAKSTISFPSAARLSNATRIKAPWLKELLQEECTFWETARCGLAEFIGSALLIFLGCMGCVGTLGTVPSSAQTAFVFGLSVMLIIQSIGHISGAHINPAITVGSVVMGKKSLTAAFIYFLAQCLGTTVGYGLLKVITPQMLLHTGEPETIESFCMTQINKDVSIIQGLLSEIMASAILMFMTCAIWDVRNERNTDSVAIKFGLTVAVLSMAFGPYSGCSMNPARSLGPAIWNNSWDHHWVYWFGPIGGALIASVLYRSIFTPRVHSSFQEAIRSADSQKAEI